MKSMTKKNATMLFITVGLLAIVVISLVIALVILPNTRYGAGVKQGETKQLEVIKSDRHKGIVPNLVGRNANQAGYWSLLGPMRVEINSNVNLPVNFLTPNGEEITKDNAKEYKVVSQEPKAGTIVDVQYYEKEYDNLIKSTSIENVTLTLEKVKK